MAAMGKLVERRCEVSNLILFGAGSAGRYALRFLREKGIAPLCFADNDVSKQGTSIDGIGILSPEDALAFFHGDDIKWIACAISRPAATEIRADIVSLGVKTKPLYECIPVFHGIPNDDSWRSAYALCGDIESDAEWRDQMKFRANPNYDIQRSPSPISELYFPPFISHREDEHFVDLGACQGDTVEDFVKRWDKWSFITAFEPDEDNYAKLHSECSRIFSRDCVETRRNAVGDAKQTMAFQSNGDYSSHLSTDVLISTVTMIDCVKLDDAQLRIPPTYMKFDVEGYELEALWGARKIIKDHSPVLAVCAYHTSDHIWEIPLLIHAINPTYKLFFRRYAEGAFEIVWYAVPPERVK